MIVRDVETILVDTHFRAETTARNMSRRLNDWSIAQIIKVTTDNGLVGFGETIVNYTWAKVTDAAIASVKGKDPTAVMWDDALGAGLQMALFDVVGKALGVPAYQLLGRKVRDWCPLSWWCIDMPPGDWVAEVKEAMALGYTSVKLKARPWFDIIEQVAAVCEIVPKQFHLDVDYNGLLNNSANAIPHLRELEKFANLAMIESPIPQGDVPGNKQIRRMIAKPLAMHYGNPPIMTALREEVCDGFVLCAGATALLKQSNVAAEANLPFWLQLVGTGITTTWALHFGAVCTHAQWPAITCLNIYGDQLIQPHVKVEGGFARLPEAPGLGVELDEDALQRLRVDYEAKTPPRRVYRFVRSNGEVTYYAGERESYYADFQSGNQPVFERGARMEMIDDDGSAAFRELTGRTQSGPWRTRE